MNSKNNTNEENNPSDEIIDKMCSECGSINIIWHREIPTKSAAKTN
jgi:hypothetical protein